MEHESTPFLAEDDREQDPSLSAIRTSAAAAKSVRRTERLFCLLTIFIAVAVMALGVLMIATNIVSQQGPLPSDWVVSAAARDLAIVCCVTFFVLVPSIFVSLPALVPLIINLTMSIVFFVMSGQLLERGRNNEWLCKIWGRRPDGSHGRLDTDWRCMTALDRLTPLVTAGGAMGLALGLLLMIHVLARVVVMLRNSSQYWTQRRQTYAKIGADWPSSLKLADRLRPQNPFGFTVQFSLVVTPAQRSENTTAHLSPVRASPQLEQQTSGIADAQAKISREDTRNNHGTDESDEPAAEQVKNPEGDQARLIEA